MTGCGTQSSGLADEVRISQWLDSLRILEVFSNLNELMILLAGPAPARCARGQLAVPSPWGNPCGHPVLGLSIPE